ncbi:hypothetical protein [Sphingomonas sp.]|uniref:hypothetical protein n=1 Tax=Sphingomonas sp. TaxID=28214 RepID=UPI003B00F919
MNLMVLHTSHIVTDLGDTAVQSVWLYTHSVSDDPVRRCRGQSQVLERRGGGVAVDLRADLLVAAAGTNAFARPSRFDRVRPWLALLLLLLPPLAWLTYRYGLGTSPRASCAAVGAWLRPAWGGANLLACAGAAAMAWPQARRGDDQHPSVRACLSRVAMLVAGIFALAIVFQFRATLIVPSCAR